MVGGNEEEFADGGEGVVEEIEEVFADGGGGGEWGGVRGSLNYNLTLVIIIY